MKTTTAFSPSCRLLLRGLLVCGGLLPAAQAGAGSAMDMAAKPAAQHEMRMPMSMPMPSEQDGYARTLVNYTIPDVKLVDADGAKVSLRATLADKPVILNFIFTSCGAICPVMSKTFEQLQDALGPDRGKVRMVSISIDPEQDTPTVLKAYAEKYSAGPQWKMLTGSLDDSISVQRAFDVYRGDKMDHLPATFLRAGPGKPWVRLDGFASASDILHEYRQITAKN
ncbi:MAG: SCO family protein [Hyphomicrobiaceae bacterium]